MTHANLTISIFLCHIAEKTVVEGEAKNGDTKEETVEEFKSRMNKLMTNQRMNLMAMKMETIKIKKAILYHLFSKTKLLTVSRNSNLYQTYKQETKTSRYFDSSQSKGLKRHQISFEDVHLDARIH